MFFYRLRFTRWKETATSRVVAAVLLLAMVLAIGGLPQPIRKQIKPGERFPCESCACGCGTAAFCWDQCCCHTDLQKLAWAEKNGVTAPDFLVARVAAAKLSTQNLASSPSCCRKAVTKSCCATGSSATSCNEQASASDSESLEDESGESVRIVSFRAYAKCRGMNLVWTLLNEISIRVLDPCSEVELDAPLIAWFQIKSDSALNSSLEPDPPVPWQAV